MTIKRRNRMYSSYGPSLVVASSTATAAVKDEAHYLCDGIADDVQINAAVALLATTGGTIFLTEGQFNLAGHIGLPYSNITLRGSGIRTTTLKAASGLNNNMIRISNTTGDITGITIESMSIDGNYALQNDGGIVEDRSGIYFKGSIGAGLVDAVLRDLYIQTCRGMGISMEGVFGNECVRLRVDNVKSFSNGLGGTFAGDGMHLGYCNDVSITGFNAQLNTDTGLAIDYSNAVNVTDVVCRGNSSNQLAVGRESTQVSLKGLVLDGLGIGNYGLRTGRFGAGAAGVSTILNVDDAVIIKCAIAGILLEDHSVAMLSNVYCLGGTFPSGNNNAAAVVYTPGSLGVSYISWGTGMFGIVAQKAGSSSVASGQTSVVVTHGLNANVAAAIPLAIRHITITPSEIPTTSRTWAVTAVTSTTFTLTLSGDPGASNFDFTYQIRLDL